MLAVIPDIDRLTQIFSQATAPTFFLGAIAAFVSLMSTRLSVIIIRIRTLNNIPTDDPNRSHLKSDIDRLRQRAAFLSSGIIASLIGGISATVLLGILFASEFFGLKYAYGASLLFLVATVSLGYGLFRFAQEAKIGLVEFDEFE